MLVTIVLWRAIFASRGVETINGYTLPAMITYLLGAGLMNSFLWLTIAGEDVANHIRWGDFSNLLTKPVNISLYYFFRDLPIKLMTLALSLTPLLIIFLGFKGFLVGPTDLSHLLALIPFIFIAVVLHFTIFYLLGLFSFWLEHSFGVIFIGRVIIEIATGALVPLNLFPQFWSELFQFLPFKYLTFIPLQIYLGRLSGQLIMKELIFGFGWLFIFASLVFIIWRIGLKRYSAVGK